MLTAKLWLQNRSLLHLRVLLLSLHAAHHTVANCSIQIIQLLCLRVCRLWNDEVFDMRLAEKAVPTTVSSGTMILFRAYSAVIQHDIF